MELPIKIPDFPAGEENLSLGPAAEEAGAMPGGQGRYLVEEEQRCIAISHRLMVHVLVMQLAGNPVWAGPPAFSQGFVITVKPATAIAEHGAAFWRGNKRSPWIDAILQCHVTAGQVVSTANPLRTGN
jgi:hypothetical protein